MDRLELVIVKNPFDKSDREVRTSEYTRQSVQELILNQLPLGIAYTVSVNGQIIEDTCWGETYPFPGDQVVVITKILGGSDGKKSILRTVLMIVVTVVATVYGGPLGGALGFKGTMASALGGAIISIAGGMLVNAIAPPVQPELAGAEDMESSPSYSWSPQLTQQQGLVIPKWYGTSRAHSGNIIASHLEASGDDQYINALICYGFGPIGDLTDVYINDQPISNFTGVEIFERRGWVDQDVISNFNDTKSEDVRNLLISSAASETYTTGVAGTDFDSLELEFECPQGLWYANDRGGMDNNEIKFTVGIRLTGTADALNIISATATSEIYYWPGTSHWEYGRWVDRWHYVNEEAPVLLSHTWNRDGSGSSNIEDHTEGERYIYYDGVDRKVRSWHWVPTGREIADATVTQIVLRSNKTAVLRHVLTVESGMFDVGESYDIVITKDTTDRDDPKYGDILKLAIVREVEETDFQYPRNVLLGVRALATDQLSGSLRVSVLGNWAIVNTYDGTSWTLQQSNNPAWVCYDILSQPVITGNSVATYAIARYDGIPPDRLDYAKFKEWADYCDGLVVGVSGNEVRSQFNGNFDISTSMWEAALQVCEVGRAMLLWNGTGISIHIDKPASPVQLFSMGNIIKDSFSEQFLSQADRISEIDIDYINEDNEYLRDKVTIINSAIDSSTNKATMSLKGVTRYSEAYRLAMLKLNYNAVIARTMSWSASIDALACQIGDVVYLQHDVPQWGTGGRIISNVVDSNLVTLDQVVSITAGTFVLTVRHNDDSLVQYTILNAVEETTELITSSNITEDISFCSYAFGELNQDKKPVRIVNMGRGQDQDINITAVDYNASVYNVDTNTPVIDTHDYSSLDTSGVVSNLAIEENLILVHGIVTTQLVLTWQNNENVKECEVWVSSGGVFTLVGKYLDSYYFNSAIDEVTYTFYVLPINQANRKGLLVDAENESHLTVGKTALPADAVWQDIDPFVVEKFGIRLNWQLNTELDFLHFKLSYGDTYETSTALTTTSGIDWLWEIRATGDYTLWLVAVDTGGRESENPTSQTVTIASPSEIVLTTSILGEHIHLDWTLSTGDFAIEHYELRQGTDWINSDLISIVKGTTYAQKVTCTGTHDWFIRAVDVADNESTIATDSLTIVNPGVVTNFSAQVIDNYVLLKFNAPVAGTLPIILYTFSKGGTFAGSTEIGSTDGTFNTIFETESGTYTYWVVAVDSAGNTGTEISITTVVNQPPDFILNADWNSDFSGTKTNCTLNQDGKLILPVSTTETWTDHFNVNNSFASIQAQIDAGYPYYAQPTEATAQYVEIFDYGTDLASTKVSVQTTYEDIVAGISATPTISVCSEADYPTFGTPVVGSWEVFMTEFRYVRVQLDWSGGDTALREISVLNVKLDAKLRNDSGQATSSSTVDPETVFFNITDFVDITSIVITPAYNASYPVVGVYDFTDVANPTDFDVYLYRSDTAARVTGDFSWSVKGY